MPESSSSVTDVAMGPARPAGRLAAIGIGAIVLILLAAAVALFLNLPDANVFNARVEKLFVENADLTTEPELRLLEILAQSGSAFSDTLTSYRVVLFVLLLFATALLVVAFVLLAMLIAMSRRMSEVDRAGIQINSLIVSRAERVVYLNSMAFELTEAAMETLAALCEARLDDDVLSGVALESLITGKPEEECEEAAGATRVKRLRDALGNQIVSDLLVRTITRKGYWLAIDRGVIQIH